MLHDDEKTSISQVAPPLTWSALEHVANEIAIEAAPARFQQTAWNTSTNMNVSEIERAEMSGEDSRLGIKRTLAMLALACMWVSAQAPLYLMGRPFSVMAANGG